MLCNILLLGVKAIFLYQNESKNHFGKMCENTCEKRVKMCFFVGKISEKCVKYS